MPSGSRLVLGSIGTNGESPCRLLRRALKLFGRKAGAGRPNIAAVRVSQSWLVALFCLISAIAGAALANPLMESLSNAGVFGPGSYTDHAMVDVFAAVVLAATGGIVWIAFQVKKWLARSVTRPDWMRRSNVALDSRTLMRLLPAIFTLQIATLYAMETVEQIAIYGHILGPTIWLGGPAVISLLTHAVIGIAATFMLRHALRKCARAVAAIVCFVVRQLAVVRTHANLTVALARRALFIPSSSPIPCRIGERAPPLSA